MSHPIYLADAQMPAITGVGKFQPNGGNGTTQIESMFSTIVGFLTIAAGLTFLIYFLLGALNWILAGGNEKKVEEAKSYMTNGAVGLIIVVASYAIVWIVGAVLGLDILNPASTLSKITTGK